MPMASRKYAWCRHVNELPYLRKTVVETVE